MSSNIITSGAFCLQTTADVVSWQRPKPEYIRSVQPAIVISQGSAVEDNAFIPAQSVWVSGRTALLAVRAAIDEALKEE